MIIIIRLYYYLTKFGGSIFFKSWLNKYSEYPIGAHFRERHLQKQDFARV